MSGNRAYSAIPDDLLGPMVARQWETKASKVEAWLLLWFRRKRGLAADIRGVAVQLKWSRSAVGRLWAEVCHCQEVFHKTGCMPSGTGSGQRWDGSGTTEPVDNGTIAAPVGQERDGGGTRARDPLDMKKEERRDHAVELPGKPHTESRQNDGNQHPETLEQGGSDGENPMGQQQRQGARRDSGSDHGPTSDQQEGDPRGDRRRLLRQDDGRRDRGSDPRGGAAGGASDSRAGEPDHVVTLCELYREHSHRLTRTGRRGRIGDSPGLRRMWGSALEVAEDHGFTAETLIAMFELVFTTKRGEFWQRGGKGNQEIVSGSGLVTYLLRCKGSTYGTGQPTREKLVQRLAEAQEYLDDRAAIEQMRAAHMANAGPSRPLQALPIASECQDIGKGTEASTAPLRAFSGRGGK